MTTQAYRPQPALEPTPAEVAEFLQGELREGELAPARLGGMATLAAADASQISFVASAQVVAQASGSAAGLLLVGAAWDLPGRARVVVGDVWPAVARLLQWLYPAPVAPPEVHATAVLGRGVELGTGVSVGPYCVLGDGVKIGDGAVLGSHCIVDAGCTVGAGTRLVARVTLTGIVHVGARALIHPGAVLGADGFKFELTRQGPLKIPQVGAVIIEDDVEIGANTCVDRAFLHETRLGRGVKLDNLIQIGHNVEIGAMTVMAAQCAVGGSAKLGMGCMIGGQTAVADGRVLGDRIMAAGQSGLLSDVPGGQPVMGTPAIPIKEFLRSYAEFKKLPELAKRVRNLERPADPAREA
jgi:UDP-3-O-[3-hydroxymyristoyl] glucosamine N-acyltransferase